MALNNASDATSIGERVKQQRRWINNRFGHGHDEEEKQQQKLIVTTNTSSSSRKDDRPTLTERPRSRRRLIVEPNTPSTSNPDVQIIQEKLAKHRHHGTGNPLLVRSPGFPRDMAIRNLAAIIQTGSLGELPTSDSTPTLKTQVGDNDHSFWTNAVENAGSYGWTGLILPKNADTSKPFPVDQVLWFVVENEAEYQQLKTILLKNNDNNKWEGVQNRVKTVKQLAEHLKTVRYENE